MGTYLHFHSLRVLFFKYKMENRPLQKSHASRWASGIDFKTVFSFNIIEMGNAISDEKDGRSEKVSRKSWPNRCYSEHGNLLAAASRYGMWYLLIMWLVTRPVWPRAAPSARPGKIYLKTYTIKEYLFNNILKSAESRNLLNYSILHILYWHSNQWQ